MKRIPALLSLLIFPLFSGAQTLELLHAGNLSDNQNVSVDKVKTDNQDNVYIYGTFSGTVDFNFDSSQTDNLTSLGNPDLFVAKYDSAGTYQWAFRIGRIGQTNGLNTGGMSVTPAGDIYICGAFLNPVNFDPNGTTGLLNPVGGKDGFWAHYSTDGNLIEAHKIGSSAYDNASAIYVNSSGDVYLAARLLGTANISTTASPINYNPVGGSDALLLKYNQNDSLLWYSSIATPQNDNISALTVDNSGNVFVCGYLNSYPDTNGIPQYRLFMARYAEGGNQVWMHDYDNLSKGNLFGDIQLDNQGNVYAVGDIQFPTQFDPSGNQTALLNPVFRDVFFVKYTPAGDLGWADLISGIGPTDDGFGLDVSLGGKVLIAGNFSQSADFDPSSELAYHTAQGSSDGFIAKYDVDGSFLWMKQIAGTSAKSVQCITTNSTGKIIAGGIYGGQINLNVEGGSHVYTSAGMTDGFLATYKFVPPPSGLRELPLPVSFTMQPNIVSSNAYLKWTPFAGNMLDYKIIDVTGKCLFTGQFSPSHGYFNLNTALLSKGLYFLRISRENQSSVVRFIKK